MQENDPYAGYRPFVIKAVGFFFRHPLVMLPVAIAAMGLKTVLPAKAIQVLLFRERTPETLRIAGNVKTCIHADW